MSSFYSYKFIGLDPENGLPLFDDMEDEKEKLYGADKIRDIHAGIGGVRTKRTNCIWRTEYDGKL